MDGKQKKSCKQCGSTEFEEIDALYYCSICSTQVTGSTIEVSHFEGMSGLKEVRVKTKKKKGADTGPPWTSMEAFNIILAHQCSQLETKLNLGPKFRCALFSLWAEYLSKCEVAFTRNEHSKPKVNFTSHPRDIQLLHEGLEKVTKPLSLAHKTKDHAKVGNTKLLRTVTLNQKRTDIPEEHDNDSHVSHAENSDIADSLEDMDESIEPELNLETETDLNLNNTDGADSLMYSFDPIDFHLNEIKPPLDGRSNYSSMLTIAESEPGSYFKSGSTLEDYSAGLASKAPRQWKTRFKSKKDELRTILSMYDNGADFDELIRKLDAKYKKTNKPTNEDTDESQSEDDEAGFNEKKPPNLSKRSLLIKKVMANDKHASEILRNNDIIMVERMTIHKTLQFILLAFKICNYNIHAGDIIHWINLGHLIYYNAPKVLPEEWVLLPGSDINSLHPRKVVHIESLERSTMTLKKFLIPQDLHHPSFIEMLKRHIFELNLPSRLIDIIANVINWKVIAKASPAFKLDDTNSIIPCYDAYSFCSIVVILKKLFILNNKTEFLISDFVRKNFGKNSFVWKDWLDHTRILWKLMNHHYLPVNSSLALNVVDTDVIRVHRDKIATAMFGLDASIGPKSVCFTKDFKNNLASLMKQSFEIDNCAIDLPPFTVYHLYEAKRFIRNRLNNLNQSSHIFEENFTNKSIDYLFNEKYTFVDSETYKLNAGYERVSGKLSAEEAVEGWPEPMKLLLNLGTFMLNRPIRKLAPLIVRLDSVVKDLPVMDKQFPDQDVLRKTRSKTK